MLDIPADLMTRTNDELNAWFDGVRRDSPEDVPDAIAALSEVYAPRRAARIQLLDRDCGHTDPGGAGCDLGCVIP
ncbi:hypothetical protein SAMN04490357_0072 [Streptomyces misionensis]|uniref:Uncharacterized protein n=1 Tax=Streptomyces misionensis TaxID=67331 RepID=A0A1H4IBU5_9ACTN|nr:hypothetical protein [Streptomyces misionensis]SEB30742.1 hypothetical protein SAMN04490357_0072 [Streptomyces misionensis]